MGRVKSISRYHGLKIIYGVGAAACLLLGWFFQHIAFTPASPPGAAYAVAFVQDPKTTAVVLTAMVDPNEPWRDSLRLRLNGATAGRDHWLLIVECPSRSAKPAHPATLVSTPALQPGQIATVNVMSGVGEPGRPFSLGCFARTRSNSITSSNTPGYGSIASVTLPTLETDAAIEGSSVAPTLYEYKKSSSGPVSLVQAFPQTCASSAPTAATASPGSSASPSATASPAGADYIPRSAAPTASASPSQQTPKCGAGLPAGQPAARFALPASMQTEEVLTDVNLQGYQVESLFPAPLITNLPGAPGQPAEEQYTWSSISSLSPSLIVSNLAGAATVSRYSFIAGILLGIAGAAIAAFLKEIWPDTSSESSEHKKTSTEVIVAETTPIGIADGEPGLAPDG